MNQFISGILDPPRREPAFRRASPGADRPSVERSHDRSRPRRGIVSLVLFGLGAVASVLSIKMFFSSGPVLERQLVAAFAIILPLLALRVASPPSSSSLQEHSHD